MQISKKSNNTDTSKNRIIETSKNHQITKSRNHEITKSLITIFLVVVFLLCPKVGFLPAGVEGSTLLSHIVFPFCHANIFHLLCNLMCLWVMKGKLHLIPAFTISLLCSFLPQISPSSLLFLLLPLASSQILPIMGCSGVLFAIIGIKYGEFSLWKRMWKQLWLFFAITAFIPNIAWSFHIYCLIIGYACGYMITTYRIWRKAQVCL